MLNRCARIQNKQYLAILTAGNYYYPVRSLTTSYLFCFKGRRMLGKFRSIFIVPVFEFIGNISYLSKYILWLKVVLLWVKRG